MTKWLQVAARRPVRLLCVSALDFSVGGAAQARQLALMRGLGSFNLSVSLLNLQPNHDGFGGLSARCMPAYLRVFPWRLQLLLFLTLYLAASVRSRPDIVMCYDRDPLIMGCVLVYGWLIRRPVVHELTEFPDQVAPPGFYGKLHLALFRHLFLRRLAGTFVISRALEEYVRNYNPRMLIVRFPAMAQENEHQLVMRSSDQKFKILYTGSLSEKKDGVRTLIKAFARIVGSFPYARLVIYGHGASTDRRAAEELVKRLNLSGLVQINDPVDHAEIRRILANAGVLALARPSSRQATGGFPTKLAEYLASGRPVVTTITGDIGLYLRDGVSAYLVPPCDTDALSDAFTRIFSNYSAAEAVGAKGQLVATDCFGPSIACSKVAKWVRSVVIGAEIR